MDEWKTAAVPTLLRLQLLRALMHRSILPHVFRGRRAFIPCGSRCS